MSRRRRRPGGSRVGRERPAPGPGARAGKVRFPERGLVVSVHACLALVLLTPLVAMPEVLYPFTVGKALYARSLIAGAFALWAVLAVVRPAWRPRFDILTVLLALTLVVGLVSAFSGISLQRSLWSGYPRMGGLVDAAHWLAFAVLLSAMLRTAAHWRYFLNLNLAVGLAAALVGAARFHFPEATGVAWWPEPHESRASAIFANPLFFAAHMQAVALLAAGFLVQSFLGAPAPAALRAFWALTAVVAAWALTLSGSMGAMAGLGAGAGGAALFHAVLGPSPAARLAGRAVLGALVLVAIALAAALLADRSGNREAREAGAAQESGFTVPLFERVTSADRIGSTFGKRLDNWEAGLRAFTDRPVLGWGPGNYLAAASLYDRAAAKTNRARDRAHNEALERAVTGGIPGLLAWLALWGATFATAWRGARRSGPEGTLAVFAGAALLGWLVQSLTSFYSPTSWMQHVLLLAFLAHAAREVEGEDRQACRENAGTTAWPAARAALAAAAIGLACASLAANRAIHAGAAALYRAETSGPFMAELRNSIRAFGPLATHPRILLFENVAPNWRIIHGQDPARAFRLLAWAEAEEREALAAEPRNWQLLHALAQMYAAVAQTSPQYAPRARYWHDRSRAAAPFQDPLMPGKPGGRGGR